MARKENQRITLTKKLLQEGLLRLLETKRLDKISVTELCREAGINWATFYNHYDSPQGLLTELEQNMKQDLNPMIRKPLSKENMVRQLEDVCIYLKEHKNILRVLIQCHADDDLAEIFNQLDRHYINSRLGASQNTLDSDSIHLVSTFLYSGSYNLIMEWLIRDIPKSPRQIAELVLSIISKDYL